MSSYYSLFSVILCLLLSDFGFSSILPEFKPNYKEALSYSLLFYESQRSGKLPNSNRIKWRDDSALGDKGVNGEDLTGGYYDASDFVKFGYTMAFTTTILSWGILAYKDSYVTTGEYSQVLDTIQWATDYFIKCHVAPNEFYGQVGGFSEDHAFWGRPEEMNMTRPAYKIDEKHPGSDLAGEASAALSAASLVFQRVNKTYSRLLLEHSEQLFNFAKNYKGLYQEVIPGAKLYYYSTSFGDELTWSAIWLYKATGIKNYLKQAEEFYNIYSLDKEIPTLFFYNEKIIGIQVLLGESTMNKTYLNSVKKFCDHAIHDQMRTPLGLIYVGKSGTLSHASNIAFICLQAAEFPDFPKQSYVSFAKEQIAYILGRFGKSYVVGYGDNFPERPYHSASSCPDRPKPCGWHQFNSTSPNPQILYGALVGGPNQTDHYDDIREEFLYSEVSLDFNAGFQGTIAALIHYDINNTLDERF